MQTLKMKFGAGIIILLLGFLISQGIYRSSTVVLHSYTYKAVNVTEQMHTAETFHSSMHEMLILASEYAKEPDSHIKEQYTMHFEDASSALKQLKSQASSMEHMTSGKESSDSALTMKLIDGMVSRFALFQGSLNKVFLYPADQSTYLKQAEQLFDDIFHNYYLELHGHHKLELADMQKNAHDIKIGMDIYFVVQLLLAFMLGALLLLYFDRVMLKLYKVTEQLSMKDALTSLYNRRYLVGYLDKEIRRSVRHMRPFSVAMLDIDDFKKYNDTFGHRAGDELLKDLSSVIQASVRNVDTIVRYGGEEFLIIFPETEKPSAVIAAERIRSDVTAHSFLLPNGRPAAPVTVSIGIASFPVDGTFENEIIEKADKMLYKAKKQGKNRVASGRQAGARLKNPVKIK